ncbi:hypothetical protein Aca07nite_72220 [Actinoplanes capillaceus]|uniref:TnsA-like heteromeric transposase endonuclease subunit n=2 Tax=Actinoplanes campanulatus TaxID=113559 RepID=A0ABQ3WUK1_9ACTN|nr:hypothetical protein Aca07nite_72220 [Actinoplanes capillaceus]
MTAAVRVSRHAEFLVEFSDSAGQQRSGDLTELWNARFEDAAPVRSFPSFKKQRNFPGWWWSATVDRLVGFESWLERDHLMQLDFDKAVVGMASQPMWLRWRHNDRWRRHAPDYFVRLADGGAVVIDVRADDRIPSRDAEAFTAAARACGLVGWRYRRVGALALIWSRNLRWLSRYRHPRFAGDGGVREGLVERFGGGMPLRAGACAVADPLVSLPVLFHLLWRQVLVTDLTSAVLSSSVIVRPGPGGRG